MQRSRVDEDLFISGALEEVYDYEWAAEQRAEVIPELKLEKDVQDAARLMERFEARYQVSEYYKKQDDRKRLANQQRELTKRNLPHELTDYQLKVTETLEKRFVKIMDIWTDQHVVGRWCKSLVGVGPIISAGMLAHIDINRAQYAGQIWSFAGYSPSMVWEKHQRRPFNLDLKVLLYNFGQCAIKTQNLPGSFYGKYYRKYRDLEDERDARGEHAEDAARRLRERNYRRDTLAYEAYSKGHFPKAHLLARAARKTIKLFISHWHYVMYVTTFGEDPPPPYPMVHLDPPHEHYIPPPNWPMVEEERRPGRWGSVRERIQRENTMYGNNR